MSIYSINYDLKAPGKDYNSVYDYLKGFEHCRGLDSCWLIDTNKSAAQIRDDLIKMIDSNDVIFIVELKHHWGSLGYRCAEWLKDSRRTWS